MPDQLPVFEPFQTLGDDPEFGNKRDGHRPVIFDVVKGDGETSLLPEGLKMVMHVNPRTMSLSYGKQTERTQTRGGFVEFHWGDAAEEITFESATGGFMRLYSGLSNITGGIGTQGRRETIAYEKYLDMLALFHNNGSMYDPLGNIVVQGYIKMTFDGAVHIGWFDGQFVITESAQKPYLFELSARFIMDREILRWRSADLGLRNDQVQEAAASNFSAQSITQSDSEDNPQLAGDRGTSILDPTVDPFADPFRGPEVAPGVFLPPGSTTRFPAGGGG